MARAAHLQGGIQLGCGVSKRTQSQAQQRNADRDWRALESALLLLRNCSSTTHPASTVKSVPSVAPSELLTPERAAAMWVRPAVCMRIQQFACEREEAAHVVTDTLAPIIAGAMAAGIESDRGCQPAKLP